MTPQKMTVKDIELEKSKKTMLLVAKKCAYYRNNPQRFCSEYLGITYLKWFQKIILWAAMKYDALLFIGTRGIGKTFLIALFCVCRCILYPRTKIVVSSATFKQGRETISKITDDFMHKSSMLRNEIKSVQNGQNEAKITFKNGSYIEVKVAAETSRGARANVLVIDEVRMVSGDIKDTVLMPMLNAPRDPGYLSKPKYKDKGLQEVGRVVSMTSAWYKQSELYKDLMSYVAQSLYDDSNFFVCDLPYQVSIESGILMKETVEREMAKQTFNEISFSMEYSGMFYGASADALFQYNVLNDRRLLKDSIHNLDYYKTMNVTIPKKGINEKRILSLDIALLASRKHKNDASCFVLNQCLCNNGSYTSNYSYIDTIEGLTTEELGLMTMRYFYQYDCDYLAIDANGIGLGVLDYIMSDRYDPVYGVMYTAMTTVNNLDLNIRCKNKNANKCVYAIKANSKMNNDMILSLRASFQNGNINLLSNENEMEDLYHKMFKSWNKMSDSIQLKIKAPYFQTSALIDELINLDHDVVNNLIKVKEKSGMRKDRFSSILYNNYVVDQLRLNDRKQSNTKDEILKMFSVRTPKHSLRFGS